MTLGPRQCPRILVGTKKDIRDYKISQNPDECVSETQGQEMCDEFKFKAYVETSAKDFDNILMPW